MWSFGLLTKVAVRHLFQQAKFLSFLCKILMLENLTTKVILQFHEDFFVLPCVAKPYVYGL